MNKNKLIKKIAGMSEEERNVFFKNMRVNGADEKEIKSLSDLVKKELEDDQEPAEIQMDDDVEGMTVEPVELPEVEIPEDFDI